MSNQKEILQHTGCSSAPLLAVVILITMFIIDEYLLPRIVPGSFGWNNPRYSAIIPLIGPIIVCVALFIIIGFRSWRMNDHSPYNPAYGGYARWHWYSGVILCVGFIVCVVLEMPNIRNEALLEAVGKSNYCTEASYGSPGQRETDIIRKLLNKGADPNHLDEYGRVVIFRAIWQKETAIFEALLDHGANWNVKDYNGVSIFTDTLYNGEPYDTCTGLLLKHGAKPDFLERADVERNYKQYLHRKAKLAKKR